jgi:hypothetical protein
MRSHRTRTSHSLVPSTSTDYFTTRLKKYAYNKKLYTETLTSVARLALNMYADM